MELQFKIADSKIHGKGVIATTIIPKNTRIGVAIEVDVEPYAKSNSKYGCFETDDEFIYFEITGNLGVWVNHQDTPKATSKLIREGNTYYLVSLRDIMPNEEISCDYQFTPFFIKKTP